jgi:hypothetical protein
MDKRQAKWEADCTNAIFPNLEGELGQLASQVDMRNNETMERLKAVSHRRRQMMIKGANMVVIVTKVHFGPLSTVFAFIYARHVNKKLVPVWYCISGALQSSDGEYRRCVEEYDLIDLFMEKFYKEVEPLEELVMIEMEAGVLSFQTEFLYPESIGRDEEFEKSMNNSRVIIHLYMMAWLVTQHAVHNNFIENHIDPSYALIFSQDVHLETYELVSANLKLEPRVEVSYHRMLRGTNRR